MKIRHDFVTNSSSSSFIITNKYRFKMSVAQFVEENFAIIDEFNAEYNDNVTHGEALLSAEKDFSNITLYTGENIVVFGDESGTVLGRVFDYALRGGGHSENFSWRYHESLR